MTIKSKIARLALLLVSASLFSCNHYNGTDGDDVTNININDLPTEDSVYLSDIMEISRYIVLETPSDEHLVGEISKIIHADSLFIILDQITSSIFEPVSTRAVAIIVSEPPFSIFLAVPKNLFGFCRALLSTPPVNTFPDEGAIAL